MTDFYAAVLNGARAMLISVAFAYASTGKPWMGELAENKSWAARSKGINVQLVSFSIAVYKEAQRASEPCIMGRIFYVRKRPTAMERARRASRVFVPLLYLLLVCVGHISPTGAALAKYADTEEDTGIGPYINRGDLCVRWCRSGEKSCLHMRQKWGDGRLCKWWVAVNLSGSREEPCMRGPFAIVASRMYILPNLHSISESAWCSSTGLRFNLLVYGSTDFTSEHLIAGIVSQVNKRSLVSRKALWKDGIIPYTLRIEGSRKS